MIVLLLGAILVATVLEHAILRIVLGNSPGWGRGVVVYLLPHGLMLFAVVLLSTLAVNGEWIWLGEMMAVDQTAEITAHLSFFFVLAAPFFIVYGLVGVVILGVMISRRQRVTPTSR